MGVIAYACGQALGQHSVRYLEELEGVLRANLKGYRHIHRYALFLCGDCPNEFRARVSDVKSGKTKSCGCRNLTARGLSRLPSGEMSPIYRLWATMINRCHNSKNRSFKNYGARGISVCPEWKESFNAFYDWLVNNGYEKGLQIDRRNNDGDYSPDNCRFVTNYENSRNKRTNRHCWVNGEKMIFADAASVIGVNKQTIGAWANQPIDSKKFRKRPVELVFEEPSNV
jgi:hypothetical protein